MSGVNDNVWQSLISCINETSDPKDNIYVLFVAKPVQNEFSLKKDFYSCEDGLVAECAPCPLDDLILYVRAGKQGEVIPNSFGFAERVLSPDSARVSYNPDAFRKLNHEVGVRLLRLSETGRDVYFTSHLLGYESAKVDAEMIDTLLGLDKSTALGFVTVDILKKLSPDNKPVLF